jgi:hypothetical protein
MTTKAPAHPTQEGLPRRTSDDRTTSLRKSQQTRTSIQAIQGRDHCFFLTMAILAAITVFVGFFPTYYQKPLEAFSPLSSSPRLSTLILAHGAVFTFYILFYVLQTALAGVNRKALHMTLGWASVVLIPTMMILGTAAILAAARNGSHGVWPDPETAAFVNGFDLPTFASLAAAAILLRAKPEAHKRLMLLAVNAGLLPPALARTPLIRLGPAAVGAAVFAFLLAGPVYDLLTRRRIHAAYAWSLVLIIATMPPTRLAVGHTQSWHRFVDWVIVK